MRLIKADKIFDGNQFLDANATLLLNNQNELEEIIYSPLPDNNAVEHYSGILCPGFVNAHCHLELSHFLGAIAQHSGLPAFAKCIVKLRPSFKKQIVQEQMQIWDANMYQHGIVAVGDICNNEDSFSVKQNSQIYYHSFIELIGLNPIHADNIFNKGLQLFDALKALGLKGSLAPHALYSTSLELIKRIADFNHQHALPSSIHLDESIEEHKFLNGEKSGFDELYSSLGIDLSWYLAPKKHGIELLSSALISCKCLLVHNTFADAFWQNQWMPLHVVRCFCPNANLYIENQLPEFKHLSAEAKTFCVGTDSLASNHHLDMVSEMNLLKKYSPFTDEEILRAATANGANALGIEQLFGRLMINKNVGLNQLQIHKQEFKFIKKIS